MKISSSLISLILGGALLVSTPAGAIVQPRVYDWNLRLTKALPDEIRQEVESYAQELKQTATSETIKQRAQDIPCTFDRAPVELFLGIKVLLARDRHIEEINAQWHQTKHAIGACQKYLRRLDDHIPGQIPQHKVERSGDYEALSGELAVPEWQQRLRLPYFDENTSDAEQSQYRVQVQGYQNALEAQRDELYERYTEAIEASRELRKYVLNLCDSLDPLTCKPYAGKRPLVLVIPPPSLEARPLSGDKIYCSKHYAEKR